MDSPIQKFITRGLMYSDIRTSVLPDYASDFVVEKRLARYRGKIFYVKNFKRKNDLHYRMVSVKKFGNFLLVQNHHQNNTFDHRVLKNAILKKGLDEVVASETFGKFLRFVSAEEYTSSETDLVYGVIEDLGTLATFLKRHRGTSIIATTYNSYFTELFFFKQN